MLSQKFWINYRSFTSVVLCTQTLHQQWLHTRACYKNHRPTTIMVISLSLRFVDQIGTSVRFWPKKWNAETLKAIVSKTAPLAKLPPVGFLFIHEIWRFHTKCRCFHGNRADQLLKIITNYFLIYIFAWLTIFKIRKRNENNIFELKILFSFHLWHLFLLKTQWNQSI